MTTVVCQARTFIGLKKSELALSTILMARCYSGVQMKIFIGSVYSKDRVSVDEDEGQRCCAL